jgi:hypothetical protein
MQAPPPDPDPKNDMARAAVAPAGPADDLGAVWQLLDALPPAAAGVDLAATTVDLVAAKVAGATETRDREWAGLARWTMPVAAVVASLAVGLVAGRVAAPDPDQWVLDRLPVIEHLGLLREAGSIEFLDAVAQRMSVYPELPRWLRAGDPQSLREEAREFDAAIGKLEAWSADRGQGREATTARRASVAALPAARKADLERDVETFRRLSSLDRGELTAVAAALADPKNNRLRDAARRWHVFLAAMNPVVRRTVIEMPADDRLEMLERPAGRPRDEFRERRPNGDGGGLPRWPPNGPRPTQPGLPPPRDDPPRELRPGSARDQGLRFPPPGAGPRAAPAETPAPPR